MIVDFHIHLSPGSPSSLRPEDAAEPRARYASGIPVYTEHGLLADVEGLLLATESAGIDLAVLSSGRGLNGDAEGARAANRALAQVAEQHPRRLRFLAHVPSPAEPGWLDEPRRWLDACPGAALPSDFGSIHLDDDRLDPLYALLEGSRKFLWIHPALAPRESDSATYGAYDLYRTVGREFALAMGTLRLVLGGVLDRHPGLTVIVSHLGGGISSLVPRVRSYQDKRFWGIAGDPVHGRAPARPFDEYLSRIYFDTGGFFGDPAAVDIALRHIPPDRILLGTDYPQEIRGAGPMRGLVEALRQRGLAGQGAELVAAGAG
jgi:5-carboxyvanillate decarboxylase